MSHAHARLTPAGRFVMVQRIAAGRPVAHVAAEMGVSRTTAWRWWRRFQDEGRAGLVDRSSVPRTHPRRTSPCVETRVRIARMLARRGPVWIGHHLGLPASTVGRVLARHRTALLRECDPLTGALIRATRRSANRYEHPHPGSLVHVDVKKLGRIADGGGWRVHGRAERLNDKRGLGYDQLGITLKFIRPHCPWTNGKAERLNRTLATEWAYSRVFDTNADAPPSCPPGSSTTTWTDPISASAANDPSTASTTLRVSTPSSGDQVTTMA